MSHKLVYSLGLETHAQVKLIFPVNIWESKAPLRATLLQAAYVGLATFTVNTYHTL